MAKFSDLSWKNALSLAPALVESGRKLWERVASRRAPSVSPRPGSTPPATSAADSLSALEVKLLGAEQRLAQLEEEAAASLDVVRSITQQQSQLAEQHAELVQAVDALLSRTRLLGWAGVALAVAFVALLVVAIVR